MVGSCLFRLGPLFFRLSKFGAPMLKRVKLFLEHESGAVTVDWVVLTAAIVGFGFFIGLYIAEPVKSLDAKNGAAVSSVVVYDINTDFSGTTDP